MSEKKTLQPLGVQSDLIANISINVTKLLECANQCHSAFTKSGKGDIYANVTAFINKDENEYEQNISLMLNSREEMRTREQKAYIGNGRTREMKAGAAAPLTESQNLSVTGNIASAQPRAAANTQLRAGFNAPDPNEDLPF